MSHVTYCNVWMQDSMYILAQNLRISFVRRPSLKDDDRPNDMRKFVNNLHLCFFDA